jgi:peptidoglycan/xylan/chitin deacetylase (PgdA/CDA1 family)
MFCHYVFDDQLEQFENIIVKLKKQAKFVDTETALQIIRGEKPVDQAYLHLSFDDGLKNNFTNALPILLKHEVPALFFVPSALMGASWEMAERYCLHTTHYNGVIEPASWADLQQAVASGYEIGSHSKHHAKLSAISGNAKLLSDEVAGSKQQIEDQLGVACNYIAWPYGTAADIDQQGFEAIRQAGYQAAFANCRSTIKPGVTDVFNIPRHHFESQWPWPHIEYFVAKGRLESD